MTKNDLRTGMVVELRNGQRYLVLLGELPTACYGVQEGILISDDGFKTMDTFNDGLRNINCGDDSCDVIKVFKGNISSFRGTLSQNLAPIWTWQSDMDWSKVTVDTKVYVRDFDHHQWKPKHFARYQGGKVFTWVSGATSFTENIDIAWKYAKLAKEVRQ